MVVTLLHATPLLLADHAIGKCWNKESKDVGHMIERMDRVGNKYKHSSTLEHINYTWDIDGISRCCLQELARHRHQSLSVKSTRYTLKELKDSVDFEDFFVLTGDEEVDNASWNAVWNVSDLLKRGVSNDIAKYAIPESYKTSLVSTMNMRGLQNFLALRTNKAALWEIQQLAYAMYDSLPETHKFMYNIKEQNDR